VSLTACSLEIFLTDSFRFSRNFLISLAAFPKLLVCGLKGLTSGICVTMLPLFDVVFAEPEASFSLPHANIGSNPEGISVLQFSGKIKTSAVS
jgi:enoyl-CoA hydratase/carnithine racemase